MTANWSKSNRSWRGRDRQRLGLGKQGVVLAQVFDGEQTRTAVVAFLLLASLHLYLAGLFQRLAPEPYMVRACVSRRQFGRAWGANRRQPRPSAPSAGALGRGWRCSCARYAPHAPTALFFNFFLIITWGAAPHKRPSH